MTDQELRQLVREAIAAHLGRRSQPAVDMVPAAFLRSHASHAMFTLPAGAEADGPCIIEPAVMCTHCGFCKSYGH